MMKLPGSQPFSPAPQPRSGPKGQGKGMPPIAAPRPSPGFAPRPFEGGMPGYGPKAPPKLFGGPQAPPFQQPGQPPGQMMPRPFEGGIQPQLQQMFGQQQLGQQPNSQLQQLGQPSTQPAPDVAMAMDRVWRGPIMPSISASNPRPPPSGQFANGDYSSLGAGYPSPQPAPMPRPVMGNDAYNMNLANYNQNSKKLSGAARPALLGQALRG